MRRFHQQCALLLATADAHLIHDHGWSKLASNQAAIETSYSLDLPHKWQPDVLFRWYRVPTAPHVAACVSLLLLPRKAVEPGVEPITEPLACAVILDFPTPLPTSTFKPLWYARAAQWTRGPRGEWSDWRAPTGETGRAGQTRARLRAIPLAEIDSTSALIQRLLAPLTEQLERP